MINILYVTSTLARLGPTNQLLGIVKNLDREKFNPYILTLSSEPKDSLKKDFLENNIKVESLMLSRLSGLFQSLSKVKDYINKYDIKIVHTSGIRADSIGVKLKKENLPVIHISTLRNYPKEDYLVKFGALKGFLFSRHHEALIQKMTCPVACSKSLKERLIDLNPLMRFVQNGADVEKFSIAKDKENIKKELGLPLNKKILLYSGSLIERKKPLETLKSFLDLKAKDWIIIFIGDGPLEDKIRVLADESVFIKGKVKSPEVYYQVSDLFISASTSEGLPNSVMEALASGLFCILSDIEPHKELVGENSEVASLFSVNSFEEMKKVLQENMKREDVTSAQIISDYLKNNFSAQSMSSNYQKLYLERYRDE